MKVDHLLSLVLHVLQLVLTHRRPVTQGRRCTGPSDPRGPSLTLLPVYRKEQQGGVGSPVVWVSAPVSNTLPSEHLPDDDGLLGR